MAGTSNKCLDMPLRNAHPRRTGWCSVRSESRTAHRHKLGGVVGIVGLVANRANGGHPDDAGHHDGHLATRLRPSQTSVFLLSRDAACLLQTDDQTLSSLLNHIDRKYADRALTLEVVVLSW